MRKRRLLTAAATGAALLAALPVAAMAQQPQCGDVITEDTALEGDLRCDLLPTTPDVALTIGADDVRLDLAGHRIVGRDRTAIANPGYDRVTIRNGRLEGFTYGVRATGADDGRIVALAGATGGNAIELTSSNRNVLRDLELSGGDYTGLLLEGSSDNRVVDSSLSGQTLGAHLTEAEGNRLVRSSFSGEAGLTLFNANGNTIVDGAVNGYYYTGLSLTGADNVVARTAIRGAGLTFGWGVRLSGDRNVLRDNTIDAGATDQPSLEVIAGAGNVVRRNQLDGPGIEYSPKDGVLVATAATDTLVAANVASAFPDDGIDVESPSTIVRQNSANDNADLGIEAVPGVKGKGNVASGNANPLQCLNVVCN